MATLTLAPRINALEMRTKGASLAMSTNWIMNYAVVQVTLPGIQNIGWKFWIIWAVICASFVPVTYFFYPETANRYVSLTLIIHCMKAVLGTDDLCVQYARRHRPLLRDESQRVCAQE